MRASTRFVTLILLFAPVAALAGEIDTAGLRAHREFLDSVELGSRRAGGAGLPPASRYLAVELRRLGFAGGARDGSYLLPTTAEFLSPGASCLVSLIGAEQSTALTPGGGFAPFRFSGTGNAEGPLVILSRSARSEDDLGGAVVLFAASLETEETLVARAAEAASAGAVAVLFVGDPRARTRDQVILTDGRILSGEVRDQGTEFEFRPAGAEEWRTLQLDEIQEVRFGTAPGIPAAYRSSLRPARSLGLPVAAISAAAVERLLSRSIGSALDQAEAEKGALRPEAAAARVRVAFTSEKRTLHNVVGRLPGADPTRGSESVVIAARYDTAGGVDASAACALAVARVVAVGPRPASSTLILFFVAGERGELGRGGLRTEVPPLAGVSGWVAVEAAGGEPLDICREALGLFHRLADDPRLAAHPKPDAPPVEDGPGRGEPAPGIPPEPTLAAARMARLTRQLDDAATSIKSAISASPDDPELYLERGRIRLASGDLEGAERDAGKLAGLDGGKGGRAELLRYELALARGDETGSNEALNRAVEAGLPEAMIVRAWRRDWFRPGGATFAARDLSEAIRRAPESTALGALY